MASRSAPTASTTPWSTTGSELAGLTAPHALTAMRP